MANRRLVVGDTVVVRPSAVASLKRKGYRNVEARAPVKIETRMQSGKRHYFELLTGDDCLYACVWPSEVRLYDGAEERLHRRSEAMQAEVDKMKEERRANRMKGRKQ